MSDERFDGMFMTVAQQAQGIEPLMDHMFSFLRRKTDFFTGASKAQVEELVLKTLNKHADLSAAEAAKKKKAKELADKKKAALAEKKKKEEEAKAAAKAKAAGEEDVIELGADGVFDTGTSAAGVPAIPAPSLASANEGKKGKETVTMDGEEVPVMDVDAKEEEEEEEEDNTPAPEGNGGTTDKFVWTQSLSEVEVRVAVPEETKTKMLTVELTNTKLKIGIKGAGEFIVDGDFHKRIIVDDSVWTLEDNKEVVLTLTKDNKMEWWKCILVGDPEINTQKVQPENSKLGDLDAETRQTVEKMMFDQRQKAAGLPSSDELKKQEMMKKFMDSHPEMDFSKAKFN